MKRRFTKIYIPLVRSSWSIVALKLVASLCQHNQTVAVTPASFSSKDADWSDCTPTENDSG